MAYAKYFLSEKKPEINAGKLETIVRHALIEDIGRGDITTQLTISKDKIIKAKIIAKEDFLVCGMIVAEKVFKSVDPSINFIQKIKEGRTTKAKKTIAIISGKASSILTAERVALNLLSLLSGIATKTREFVKEIEPYKTKITDTRKTMPGLRELQKYAVRIGGGHNHRIRLDEMILIKDNHIKVTDGYIKLPSVPKGYKIEIEVQNLEEFKHALYFKPDVIMLDNMKIEDIRKAVKIRNNTEFKSHHLPSKLEASGGIYLDNIKDYASTGVDIISVGELTDSVKSVDISLDVI
ncbi:MAG: carboxylating nicotinate-nucleotide diphosphorylase [Candidatus Omnitrophica bacterium]|jgi:nicotinate-nucleotide pyrophosphorylase (carboxylating)|nr:carboxylating nicotinate-nucleotide diphosphorylase [Candidatus Omnitrophota bacterium]MDD5252764.1 carboxylating nicotinate-nucleotide diphosphorylase [Candidatus Omnitrophota bacterium]